MSFFSKPSNLNFQSKTDNSLTTTNKTIIGAINENKTTNDAIKTDLLNTKDSMNTSINTIKTDVNLSKTDILNINAKLNSIISEADIETIINNALK